MTTGLLNHIARPESAFRMNRPAVCECGAERVDASDSVELRHSIVAVHGLHHCFSYRRPA